MSTTRGPRLPGGLLRESGCNCSRRRARFQTDRGREGATDEPGGKAAIVSTIADIARRRRPSAGVSGEAPKGRQSVRGTKRPRRATLADVAERASVDRSVVSRVLSGDSRLSIRDSTRERVLQAVADLQYRPNATARSLRQGRTGILGLLIPDFLNPVYPAIVKGAESAAGELGAGLLVASSCDGGFGGHRYAELVTQGRIDGLVLAGQSETDEVSASLLRSGVPWLMLNLCSNDIYRCVVLDDHREPTWRSIISSGRGTPRSPISGVRRPVRVQVGGAPDTRQLCKRLELTRQVAPLPPSTPRRRGPRQRNSFSQPRTAQLRSLLPTCSKRSVPFVQLDSSGCTSRATSRSLLSMTC